MQDLINQHLAAIAAHAASTPDEVEQFRIKYLGRKGILNDLFEAFKVVPGDQKKLLGQELNKLKNAVQEKLDAMQSASSASTRNTEAFDLSRPTGTVPLGTRHAPQDMPHMIFPTWHSH